METIVSSTSSSSGHAFVGHHNHHHHHRVLKLGLESDGGALNYIVIHALLLLTYWRLLLLWQRNNSNTKRQTSDRSESYNANAGEERTNERMVNVLGLHFLSRKSYEPRRRQQFMTCIAKLDRNIYYYNSVCDEIEHTICIGDYGGKQTLHEFVKDEK